MGRLVWPLALVVTFFVGWTAAGVARKGPSAAPEVDHLQETVSRLQQQVGALQARLRARENLDVLRQSGATAQPGAPSRSYAGARVPPTDPSVAAAVTEGRTAEGSLARRGELRGDRPSSPPGSRGTLAPAPTVEAALERFYRYLEATNEPQGRERWQRMRELIDDLRGMGDVGAQALMQVLAAGSDSDERRAAARLLGTLQVPQALPLLRDIMEKEDDVLLRRAAASGLRQLQTPEAVPVMERILANSAEDRLVRLSAAYGLAESGRPLGVTGLAQIFDESGADGRGREIAFRALASLKDERPLPFMRQLVNSEAEPAYRLRAIRYLTAQGDRQALAALQVVMQSRTEQPSIRDAAAQAYRAISGSR
ncbi:MAG: HEAT repeat domain-containing protein [Candidatus Rokubacteria bacterium]|nr:HEAT repeat domain-containing protein [Candidatus Rokubacteria bacterium]